MAWRIFKPGSAALSPTVTVQAAPPYDAAFFAARVPHIVGAYNPVPANGTIVVTASAIYGDVTAADVAAVAAGMTARPPVTATMSKPIQIIASPPNKWAPVVIDTSTDSVTTPDDAFVGAMIGPFSPPTAPAPAFKDWGPRGGNITELAAPFARVFGPQDIYYQDVIDGLNSSNVHVVPT